MGLKKKKNVIVITICVVISFILYQLYFFLTITSETTSNFKIVPVLDHSEVQQIYMKSEDDKFINNIGVMRGVFYSYMPKYRPDENNRFKCLNSEQWIAFELVNDDYCDCYDGTDEPSTNACVNGTFYCDTQQYRRKPLLIHKVSSTKVNDGICDCCDGSDEFNHEPNKKLLSQSNEKYYRFYVTKCPNNCK